MLLALRANPADAALHRERVRLKPKIFVAVVRALPARVIIVSTPNGSTISLPTVLEARNNTMGPVAGASGRHTTIKYGPDGKITGYQEWVPNPENPTGFDAGRRVDIAGKPHTNKDGTKVPTPHVHEPKEKDVRPAEPDEIPYWNGLNRMVDISDIENWFSKRCDGDWEHQGGINISTTDNSGWVVEVDFDDMENAIGSQATDLNVSRSDEDYISFFFDSTANSLRIVCGVNNLSEAMKIFIDNDQ